MRPEQVEKLNKKLPSWAIKDHPTKNNMSVIHPMAVVERLNEVFGVGGWQFTTEFISCDPFIQQTKKGERNMFMSAVKGKLSIPAESIIIEQYGGSSNDDRGDALKGGATDALTKIASYLNIGAEIYKGQGNVDYGSENETVELTPRQKAEKDIAEEDDIFGLRNLEDKIKKSTKLTDKDKEELAFIANEKALELGPNLNK